MLSRLQVVHVVVALCAGVALPAASLGTLDAGEPKGGLSGFAVKRTWSSGAYKIEAKLAFADDENVKLAKTDGRTVTVPLEKLSEPDRVFVKSFLQAEKALAASGVGGDDPNNPFAGGVPSKGPGAMAPSSGNAEAGAAGLIPKKAAIVKGIRPISVSPGREFWEVESVRGFPAVEFQEIVIPTPVEKPFFAAMRMQAAGRAGNTVINSYQEDKGRRGSFGKFAVVNAVTGDVTAPLELDQPWKLMDVSADGRRIAAVRIEGFDKGNDLALLKIEDNRIVPEYQFTAGGGSWDELHYAAFLPQNRLMTISQKHNLTIWDLTNPIGPRAMYRGSSGGKLWAELSPAGELLAMIAGKSLAFVDTANFKLRGYIARDEEPKHIAFSPDGQLLAAYHPFRVVLYSMETGEKAGEFAVSESNPNTKLRWAGEHLLVGKVLYDTQKGAPLWTYESRGVAQCTLGRYLFTAFGGDQKSTLTVYQVPHNEALRASGEIDENNLYCIQPGDAVAVDYDLGFASVEVQGKIQDAVEAKVAELGWRIRGGVPNRITIKLEQGELEEADYYTRSGFGPMFFSPFSRPSGPSEKVSYRPWKHSLTIVSEGKQVYNAVMNRTAPGNLSTKEGQSTQQAVTNHCQPYPAYFKGLTIPPHILKPEYQGGLGTSTITDNGMR